MKVTYKDKIIEIQEPKKFIELFEKECNEHIIACICNNQIQSLNHTLKEDTNIEFIDISDATVFCCPFPRFDEMFLYELSMCIIIFVEVFSNDCIGN